MPGFKETYEAIKADWNAGEKNFNVACEMLPEGMQVKCTMGAKPFEIIIDAPPGLDGTNEGPSPLLVILTAVGGCIIAVINFWAKIMDIIVESLTVNSRGHIILGALFGIDDSKLPGYDKLEPVIRIKADASEEKINELIDKALSHCPIITNMKGASPITPKIQIRK